MTQQAELSAALEAIGLDVKSLLALQDKAGVFYIWCEENGAVATNAYEWSYGNGAVGNDIGVVIMRDALLTEMAFNADTYGGGSTVQIHARRAQTPGAGSIVQSHTFTSNNEVFTLPTPRLFARGDVLVVQTGTLVGTITDARPCFRFQEV